MNTRRKYVLRHSFSSTGRYLGAKKVCVSSLGWKRAIAYAGVAMAFFGMTFGLGLVVQHQPVRAATSGPISIQQIVGLTP